MRQRSFTAFVGFAYLLCSVGCQGQGRKADKLSRDTALSILNENAATLLNPDGNNNLFTLICRANVAVDPAKRSHFIFGGVAREDTAVQYHDFLNALVEEGLLQRDQQHDTEYDQPGLIGSARMHAYKFVPAQGQRFNSQTGIAIFRIAEAKFSKVTGITEEGMSGGPSVVVAEVEIADTPTDNYTRLAKGFARIRAKYPYFDGYTLPRLESVKNARVPFRRYDDGWRLAR